MEPKPLNHLTSDAGPCSRRWLASLRVPVGVLCALAAASLAFADPAATSAALNPPVVSEPAALDLPDYGAALTRMVVTLVLMVAGLLVLARYLPRWIAGTRPARSGSESLDVLSSRRLEPGRSLHIITARGRTLLVGSGPQGLTLIADLSEEPSTTHIAASSRARTAPPKTTDVGAARFGTALHAHTAKDPHDAHTDPHPDARG